MKHYWINLDKCNERKVFMEEQFKRSGLENYRIKAYTPEDLDDIVFDLKCVKETKRMGIEELACLSSHLNAIREGLKGLSDGEEYFAVLEDDSYMPFTINYNAMIESFPKDTEIMQLYIINGACTKQLYNNFINTNQFYYKWGYILPSCGFYIVSKRGAEKLLEQYYKEDINKYYYIDAKHDLFADVLLYLSCNSYCSALPYVYSSLSLGSTMHEYQMNDFNIYIKEVKEVISHAIAKGRYPFVTGIYNLI